MTIAKVAYRTVNIDGLDIFYREAGPKDAPTILLLHGFPTSSHMFRNLIPALADEFHLVAPDYPGKVERAIVFAIETWDINCPQHIHKRFSVREVQPVIEQLQRRISELEAQLAQREAHEPRPLPA